MSVWWVNQGSTYAASLREGILWAPDANLAHWRRMRDVRVGDLVIHYAGGVRAVGVVTADARSWTRPDGFNEGWPGVGLMVRVDYRELDRPIKRDDVPPVLRSNDVPGGAFDKRGAVKQGYLWVATQDLYKWIVRTAGLPVEQPVVTSSDAPGSGAGSGVAPGQSHHYAGRLDLNATSLARGEQAALRAFLFSTVETAECALCGRSLPVSLLRAAHIKRRSHCSDDERREFRAVAMPACVLGCDALFELGWIVVNDDGVIEPVGELGGAADAARAALVGRTCKAFSEWTRANFAWHRDLAVGDGLPAEVVAVDLPPKVGVARPAAGLEAARR